MGGEAMGLYYADVHRAGERLRQRAGKARRHLPKDLRREMYVEALTLASRGLGYRKIVRELREKYGLAVAKSTISCWVRGIHTPYYRRFPDEGRVKIYREVLRLHAKGYGYRMIARKLSVSPSTVGDWIAGRSSPYGPEPPAGLPPPRPTKHCPRITELRPSPELAYIIGVVLGDGYAYSTGNYKKIIGLRARDEEFVREFARCLARVLGREVKVRFWEERKLFVARACSAPLYELLRKPADLDRLRPFIEHCDMCVAAFLRGFFDSEGFVHKDGLIYICNTDAGLLSYVAKLLERLGIKTTRGPYLNSPEGRPFYDPRTGKTYERKRNCYTLQIRTHYNLAYYQRVGFMIARKRQKIEEYLKRRLGHPPLPQLSSPIYTLTEKYKLCGTGGTRTHELRRVRAAS